MRALLLLITLTSSAYAQHFLGEPVPQNGAALFAPNIISSTLYERDFAISPDGKKIYYSLVLGSNSARLVERSYQNNQWSLPAPLPFSSGSNDIEPALSPDGKKLFFASNRGGNFDIYVCTLQPDGAWGPPANVGAPVNTDANEFYPSVTEDGTLYYTARYSNGAIGGEDIWYATWNGTSYDAPRVLPASVNSEKDEYNAFVDPKGQYILFGSYGRADDAGRGDIYMSRKNGNGVWQNAVRMAQGVNSSELDYCPYVSPDGQYLFFTSERSLFINRPTNPFQVNEIMKGISTPLGGGNIYWVRFN